jgi:GT2 family glycosyltransferase
LLDISIVTHNSSKDLFALIESLASQDFDLKQIALYIQDNGSEDDTLSILNKLQQKYKSSFQHIEILQETDVGFGNGHNNAISRGKNPYILVLNPDAILYPHTLSLLLERALSDGENVAAWEPRQLPYEHPKYYNPVTLETPWMSGAAFLIRRCIFEKVGGFEPKIFLYGEDVDLSLRIRSVGYKLIYFPKSSFKHHTYSKIGEVKVQQFLGSTLANLYIRTRFGSWGDILKGVGLYFYLYLKALILKKPCPRLAGEMIKNLFKWIYHFRYFRKGNFKKFPIKFHSLEYSQMRKGSFHNSTYAFDLRSKPKISILIRTLGHQFLLQQAIQSVIHQIYPNIEIVVVEDGNETLEDFLSEFKDIPIVYKFSKIKLGRCMAGNIAMQAATGDYFIFLDEDDLFFSDHLEQLLSEIQKTGCKAAYSLAFEVPSDVDHIKGCLVKEGLFHHTFSSNFSFTKLLHHNYIPINTVLFNRSFYDELGGFNIDVTHHEDWLLWLKYSAKAKTFAFVPKTTALYRVPMQNKDYIKRQLELLESYHQIIQNCSTIKVEMTVEELFKFRRETTTFKFLMKDIYLNFLTWIMRYCPSLSKPIKGATNVVKRFLPSKY